MLQTRRRSDNSRCVVCGGYKLQQFFTCLPCAKKWGVYKQPYKTWPAWLKFLINDRQKEDYRNLTSIEVSVDPATLEFLVGENYLYKDGYFSRI